MGMRAKKKLCADIVREVLPPDMKLGMGAEERFEMFKRVMRAHVWPAEEIVGYVGRFAYSYRYSIAEWRHGGRRKFAKLVRDAAMRELADSDYADYDFGQLGTVVGYDGSRFCRLLQAEDAALMSQRLDGMERDLAMIDRRIGALRRTRDASGEVRYRIDLYDNSYEAVICGGKAGWLWAKMQ